MSGQTLSCVPAVRFDGDDELGQLTRDRSGHLTADDHIALTDAWVEQVAAGQVPFATLHHPSPGFDEHGIRFGAVLRLTTPDGLVLYRLSGHRGPTSNVWTCDRVRD